MLLPVALGPEFLQPFPEPPVLARDKGVEPVTHPAFLVFEVQRSKSALVLASSRQSRCLEKVCGKFRACSVETDSEGEETLPGRSVQESPRVFS